mmetsp:Transcript_37806/g.93616  ORF Transcript_37806/g.93616 Transcript_37806/m.93616 type:complete len:210 (-) Transcript_37806:159-788(-)
MTEIVHVPHPHAAVRAGCQHRGLIDRVPLPRSAGGAVPLGVFQVANVHVSLVKLTQLATVAVVYLRLGITRHHQELVTRGAPAQGVHGVAVVGHDLAERPHVSLHAVEVVYLDPVVVAAGDEAAARVFQVHGAHHLLVALHRNLVGDWQEVVVVLAQILLLLLLIFVVLRFVFAALGRERPLWARHLGGGIVVVGRWLWWPRGTLHRSR